MLLSENPAEIKKHLALYKDHGMLSYRKVLELPMTERIPELIKTPQARTDILTTLTAALTGAFSNLNLRFSISGEQVVELADMIIDQSHEDQLGLEDVFLFLENLLTGKAGKIYDRMDIQLFFEMFETYRQRRHEEIKALRDEEDAQYRALPVNDRMVFDSVEEEKDKTRRAAAGYKPPAE